MRKSTVHIVAYEKWDDYSLSTLARRTLTAMTGNESFTDRRPDMDAYALLVNDYRAKHQVVSKGRSRLEKEAKEYIRAYLACISYMDWNVGRVLQKLEESGLKENTVVVFWSDHGCQLGEKGKRSKAGSLWEQDIRVPFITHDPRAKGNGQSSPCAVYLL